MASRALSVCAVGISLLVVAAAFTVYPPRRPKEYDVNLDLPPQQRWTHVVRDYTRLMTDINTVMGSLLPTPLIPLVQRILAAVDDYLPHPYAEEIRGIANDLNIDLGAMVLTNILYDLTAHCTSIVAQDSRGQIWHGRNLDYGFTDILKNITIIVNFQRAGKTLYTATTYAGYVGITTGQRPRGYTISLNQRNKGAWWMNALVAILERQSNFVTFLVRDTLEKASRFSDAVSLLSDSVIIAPAYYIVGGVNPAEGAVITRDRVTVKDTWRLDPSVGRWYVLETNYDRWTQPPSDDDRRNPAIKMLNATGQVHINAKTLFKILSTGPMLNEGTTYTTIMSAAQPDIYRTWAW